MRMNGTDAISRKYNVEEVRKAAREFKLSRAALPEPSKTPRETKTSSKSVVNLNVGTDRNTEAKTVVVRRSSTKTGRTPAELMSADDGQREAARQWAQEETATTSVVTQSTGDRGSTRSRAVAKKASDKQQGVQTEDKDNLDAQEFIASQYPPVDEGVSSTVRLGRSFVSGAMERRSDDPKMFETAVELVDCSVPSRTTKEKAEIPVSDRPPNSIDSDVEEDDANDARLSQSTTDTGVHIELPEVNAETDDQVRAESVHKDASVCAGDATDEPVAPSASQRQ